MPDMDRGGADFMTKSIIYPGTVIVLTYVWIIAATGGLGEIRWWPSRDRRDRLSRLVPPPIQNVTMTKCMWTLSLYQS